VVTPTKQLGAEKMNIAQTIISAFPKPEQFCEAVDEANRLAVDRNQAWDQESTEFTFADGSALNACHPFVTETVNGIHGVTINDMCNQIAPLVGCDTEFAARIFHSLRDNGTITHDGQQFRMSAAVDLIEVAAGLEPTAYRETPKYVVVRFADYRLRISDNSTRHGPADAYYDKSILASVSRDGWEAVLSYATPARVRYL
jgi:hypothetical protein